MQDPTPPTRPDPADPDAGVRTSAPRGRKGPDTFSINSCLLGGSRSIDPSCRRCPKAYLKGPEVRSPAFSAVEECLKIKNDLDRLTCYDHEAGFVPSVENVVGKVEWTVQKMQSKIDDSTNVYMVLSSKEYTNCPYDTEAHRIGIDCRENTTLLYIYFGGCFMSDLDGGGQVTYRLDSEPAGTVSMRESNNHAALGLWNGASSISFVKKMFGHSKLLIRATPFSDSTVTAEYEIEGIEEAIAPLRDACHW